MVKKIVMVALLAFAAVSTVSTASAANQFPTPTCYPCNGGGN